MHATAGVDSGRSSTAFTVFTGGAQLSISPATLAEKARWMRAIVMCVFAGHGGWGRSRAAARSRGERCRVIDALTSVAAPGTLPLSPSSAATVPESSCFLHIKILRACGLLGKDVGGTSDPYCEVTVGTQRSRTAVISKCLDPVWDQQFTFRYSRATPFVVLELWDEDRFSSHDFLGRAVVPMSRVGSTPVLRWLPLGKRSVRSHVDGAVLVLLSTNAPEAAVDDRFALAGVPLLALPLIAAPSDAGRVADVGQHPADLLRSAPPDLGRSADWMHASARLRSRVQARGAEAETKAGAGAVEDERAPLGADDQATSVALQCEALESFRSESESSESARSLLGVAHGPGDRSGWGASAAVLPPVPKVVSEASTEALAMGSDADTEACYAQVKATGSEDAAASNAAAGVGDAAASAAGVSDAAASSTTASGSDAAESGGCAAISAAPTVAANGAIVTITAEDATVAADSACHVGIEQALSCASASDVSPARQRPEAAQPRARSHTAPTPDAAMLHAAGMAAQRARELHSDGEVRARVRAGPPAPRLSRAARSQERSAWNTIERIHRAARHSLAGMAPLPPPLRAQLHPALARAVEAPDAADGQGAGLALPMLMPPLETEVCVCDAPLPLGHARH